MAKINYIGLVREPMPSGNTRYRVRVIGNKKKRITLCVTPDHPDFIDHYRRARHGEKVEEAKPMSEILDQRTLSWLIHSYLEYFQKQADAGNRSIKTLKKRTRLLQRLDAMFGDHEMQMPPSAILKIQDEMASTPAQADAMVEAIRMMFRWAVQREYAVTNPALSISNINHGQGGATPWSKDDFKQFLSHHKKGTTPHVALSVLAFTGCRVGDLTHLGRDVEIIKGGVRGLDFQPLKKNAARVTIPMLPPLYEATRAPVLQAKTYVTSRNGKPYASEDSMSATFISWCKEAGLIKRSAHGLRKGLAELLAECGCSEYEIMAILGHTEAKTTEIYTRGAKRWNLSVNAMGKLEGMSW